MLGIVVSVILIVAMLTAAHHFLRWVWSERNPAWALAREAQIAVITQQAMADLDREYEELLRD